MEGVEHLGKYVYEMTKAKVESLKAGANENGNATGEQIMQEEVGVADNGDEDADREENVLIKEDEMNDLPEEPDEIVT
jgi:intron-binding protein aquarius